MKIKLLIATSDSDYMDHLSRVLLEKKSNLFEVTVCSDESCLSEIFSKGRFDAALLEENMLSQLDISGVHMPLLLWDGITELTEQTGGIDRIQKYQRISAMCSEITQKYAAIHSGRGGYGAGRAKITAVWSPVGGVGKTTVALALAANLASKQKNTIYFSLEPFSSNMAFFKEPGKTISTVFEKWMAIQH